MRTFSGLAPLLENALRIGVEQAARQRDFFRVGQRGRKCFPHEPGRLVQLVDHERHVLGFGRDGKAAEAVTRPVYKQEGRLRDDPVQRESPVRAGRGFGSSRGITRLEDGGTGEGLAFAVDHATDHRPFAWGALQRDCDVGSLARLDREGGRWPGTKLHAIGEEHVDVELAGGEGRDLEAALGIGRRAALAQHLWAGRRLRQRPGDDLQAPRRGGIVDLDAAGQPAGGLQRDRPGTGAELAPLETEPGGFDQDRVDILGSTALDFPLAVGVGRGREQVGERVGRRARRPGPHPSDYSHLHRRHPCAGHRLPVGSHHANRRAHGAAQLQLHRPRRRDRRLRERLPGEPRLRGVGPDYEEKISSPRILFGGNVDPELPVPIGLRLRKHRQSPGPTPYPREPHPDVDRGPALGIHHLTRESRRAGRSLRQGHHHKGTDHHGQPPDSWRQTPVMRASPPVSAARLETHLDCDRRSYHNCRSSAPRNHDNPVSVGKNRRATAERLYSPRPNARAPESYREIDPGDPCPGAWERVQDRLGRRFTTAIWATTWPAMTRSTESVSPRIVMGGCAPPVGLKLTSSWRPTKLTIQ